MTGCLAVVQALGDVYPDRSTLDAALEALESRLMEELGKLEGDVSRKVDELVPELLVYRSKLPDHDDKIAGLEGMTKRLFASVDSVLNSDKEWQLEASRRRPHVSP